MVQVKLLHPATVMAFTWAAIYLIYFIAPFNQEPSITFKGTLFVVLHITTFCLGSVIGTVNPPPSKQDKTTNPHRYNFYKKINVFLYIGILGLLINIIDKISRLPALSLLAITKYRSDSADLIANSVLTSNINWLGLISFLTYPACFVGIVATITLFEFIPKKTLFLFLTTILLILLFSIINGSRSLILVSIIFMSLTMYVRKGKGLPGVPNSRLIKIIFQWSIIFLVIYSSLVWKMRSEINDENSDTFISAISENWQVTLKTSIEPLALKHTEITQNVVSSLFYFTQSLSNIEKILNTYDMPIFMGAHQVDIISAASRNILGEDNFVYRGNKILLENNIYGFFTGSWGGLYIDFGLLGSYIASLVWGVLAGRAYKNIMNDFYQNFTQYIFWIYTIVISFTSPPLGFSNSAITFSWFVVFMLINHRRKYESLPK